MRSPAFKAGQHKLRGKKEKLLRCNCCVMFNCKEEILTKQVLKDAAEEMSPEKDWADSVKYFDLSEPQELE